MFISSTFRWIAKIICLGIALDNGINTFYYLEMENWSIFAAVIITISNIVLNGMLYFQGAAQALQTTWFDFRRPRRSIVKHIIPYLISFTSAFVMSAFTLHSYTMGSIQIPKFFSYLFTVCYFIGTYTLIIQASKASITAKIKTLTTKQKISSALWFSLFMLATLSAVTQWASGVTWLTSNTFVKYASAWLTCLGEAYFVGNLAIWLAKIKFSDLCQSYLIISSAILNAIGFACMTEYDSWITNSLSSDTTFLLGFILSFFMMIKSLFEYNVKLHKPIIPLLNHQA